jgi:hypothetical protein
VLELLVAVAVIAFVAISFDGRPVTSADRAPASPTWAVPATPVLAAVIEDLTAIDQATRSANGQMGAIEDAGRRLASDLASARALGSPGGSLARPWLLVIDDLDAVTADIRSAARNGTGPQIDALQNSTQRAVNAVALFSREIAG